MSKTQQLKAQPMTRSMFQPALPPRNKDSHKGSFGSVAIVGGDGGMVGAALLAARAALLSGAGRVYAAMLAEDAPVVDMYYPEIMMRPLPALQQLRQLDCLVIGPGLGPSDKAVAALEYSLTLQTVLLLDADALNLIAKHAHLSSLLVSRVRGSIITPHAGEAARLLATDVETIQFDRVAAALELAKKFNVVSVLKGAGSICAQPDGHCFLNTTGNPALATAGTGDVLSGLIGGFVAQGLGVADAAGLGVYVHGAAADAMVVRGVGPVGVTASEIALEARVVINRLNNME